MIASLGRLGWLLCLALVVVCGAAYAQLPSASSNSSKPEQNQASGSSQSQTYDDQEEQWGTRKQNTEDRNQTQQRMRSISPFATDDDRESSDVDEQLVAPSLPARRIISILRDDPDLFDSLKKKAAERMEETGKPLDVNLPDQLWFERIGKDARLRALITKELVDRGIVDPDDEDLKVTSDEFPDQSVKSDTRRGATTRRRNARRRDALTDRDPEQLRKEREEPDYNEPVKRSHPYPTLPSLTDLYSQLPNRTPKLKRFGASMFRSGSGNADDLPADVPVGPDYVLGPGDGLTINISGGTSQRLTRSVDREGRILLPEAGAVLVAGQTLAVAQEAVQQALGSQFQNVKVDLSLSRLRTVRVYVVGDVQRPGAYDISSLSSPLNALYAAGGPTARGSLRTVRHLRGKQLVSEVDLYELMLRGVPAGISHLQSGDTILVPPIAPQVAVAGMVRRPAIYELRNEKSLAEVIDLAGGVMVTGTLRQIQVERVEAHQKRSMISVDVPEAAPDAAKVLDGFQVQDGDRVTIAPIPSFNEKAIYLEGHVFRPGKYPYRDGLRVNDMLKSYQDLLPEPADHAEVVRLQPPDYRPVTIEFSLGELLSGDDPIDLQPFDTIRVFGRYEVDPPSVVVYGEVLRPGTYPLASGMTVAALLRMAGGFKRSAQQQQADLASYVVQNGEKVLTKHRVIDLSKALAGDHESDVALKPGDVLTVRQLTGWKDIGAAVSLRGEVLYPGMYGIEDGERLSTVLRRAGGFRPGAYPAGAVLERKQVRELADRSRQELIQRIEAAGSDTKLAAGTSASEQMQMMQAMMQQKQQVVTALRNQQPNGRLVIRISPDIEKWQGTADDIEVRAGDVLIVPKRPTFVLVNGQVQSPSAIAYTPRKSAEWYLRQAGGFSELANKKSMFIIRANGSVIGNGSSQNWWHGSVLSMLVQPGDTVVVPEKIIGSSFWKNLLSTAQLTSSLAIAARVATSF